MTGYVSFELVLQDPSYDTHRRRRKKDRLRGWFKLAIRWRSSDVAGDGLAMGISRFGLVKVQCSSAHSYSSLGINNMYLHQNAAASH